MSELRTQLDQAKRDHLAARYPGDLAADLLHPPRLSYSAPPRRHWLFWTNVGALGAVAATVALVMWRLQPATSITTDRDAKPNHIIAVLTPKAASPTTDQFSVVPQLAGTSLTPQPTDVVPAPATTFVPSLPSTLVPSATALSVPAMPSFPSMTDVLNSATSTDTNTGTKQNKQPSHKETT